MISVALLHLDLCNGPEAVNGPKLLAAIDRAGDMGADWVVTPETALHGYFWSINGDPSDVHQQSQDFLDPFAALAQRHDMTVFLCAAERCHQTERSFNTCFAISPQGKVLGQHRKIRGHGSAEAWATRGETRKAIATAPMTAGVLICADSWYSENALAMRDDGADVIMIPAAWPPGNCGPGDCWEKRSAETGLPVWVCNQTGEHPRLAFQAATSVVVQDGKTALTYQGADEAILLFDWDVQQNRLAQPNWTVEHFKMADQ